MRQVDGITPNLWLRLIQIAGREVSADVQVR